MNSSDALRGTEISSEIEEDLQHAPKENPVIDVSPGKLAQEAEERSKERPIVQRLVKALKRDDSPFREIIINSEPLQHRVALLIDGILQKFELEQLGEDRIVGSIYKGRIQNLEPGLKAAFVDIGMLKNAFLHYWDILPAANDSSIEVVRDTRSAEQRKSKDCLLYTSDAADE